jgi:hypothetical protein
MSEGPRVELIDENKTVVDLLVDKQLTRFIASLDIHV